ncbi:MAG TPA: transposase, partial [Marinilabiliaceae bacterium]|nr:transposase [Marinilabiliaceae bacterium]
QQEHHKKITFEEELKYLLEEFGIQYDEKHFP